MGLLSFIVTMTRITALIHASNDEQRLGRALDSLRACDEVMVVDHGSTDNTAKIARQHGALVKAGVPGVEPGAYIIDARHDWILCLQPNEALNESLEATLHDWKDSDPGGGVGFCFEVREETEEGWRTVPPELRLVNRKRLNWPGKLPPIDLEMPLLPGEVHRFCKP